MDTRPPRESEMPNMLGPTPSEGDCQVENFRNCSQTSVDIENQSRRGLNNATMPFDDPPEDAWDDEDSDSRMRQAPSFDASAAALSRNQKRPTRTPRSPRSPESTTTSRTVGTEESKSPGGNSLVTVEHRVKQDKSSTSKSLAKLKKPAVALLVLFLTGSAAFLFTQFLTIPGLETQIQRLEAQVDELETQVDRLEQQVDRLSEEVDRLDSEVDRLSEENDRYEDLNDELAANNAEYEELNAALSNTTDRYEELNTQLNASNAELEQLNEELREQNDQYAELNEDLNATLQGLSTEVDRLENVTNNLAQTNIELRFSVEILSAEILTLSAENEFLSNTVSALGQEVAALTNETERLAELNANLRTIVSFLNETAAGVDDAYDAISEFLSEQITAYRGFVLDTLKNLYMQRITNWDCDFRSYFITQPFVRDPSLPIGENDYPDVIDYIEERILSEVCLDTADFEVFLETEYVQQGQIPPVNVTTNELKRGVQQYTRSALTHYFPSSNDPPGDGPDETDWAEADYNCGNLPTNKKFSMYS